MLGAASTLINGVNNSGTLVGTWFTSQCASSFGFVEDPGGQPTTFSFPGTTVTFPSSINDLGTTVGAFIDNNGVPHGWVRSPGGNFTQLDDPAALGAGTVAFGINDPGVTVGFYLDPSNASVMHGFAYEHGTFTTVDYPGAASTALGALNSAGAIVGFYTDAAGVYHGFVYEHGTFTPFDAPGAGTSSGEGTFPVGISSNGLIDGQMINDSGGFGWLLGNGQFSSLNDPNAGPGQVSFPESISSNGRYVPGYYGDSMCTSHGYVATLTPGGAVLNPATAGGMSRPAAGSEGGPRSATRGDRSVGETAQSG